MFQTCEGLCGARIFTLAEQPAGIMNTCGLRPPKTRHLYESSSTVICRAPRRQPLACSAVVRQYRSLAKATSTPQSTYVKTTISQVSSIDAEKEASRQFRRTTFGIDDWKVHRSTTRYWRHMKSGFLQSRIVRGLAAPLTYVAVLSVGVCCYETALQTHLLPAWGFEWPSISMNSAGPFSLSTFALSLLLVFRTNSSYQRWCEARKFWGLLINRSRDLARQVTQWFPQESDAALTAAACRWIAAFPMVLMASLRDDVDLESLLEPLLLPHELQMLTKQPHQGSAALQALGTCVKKSGASPVEKLRIDENITVMQDIMGGCERIFKTPIPLSYTRHTSRFLVCWLTCLPFCVADSMGWMTVPIAVGLAFFLFGIEEIGVQIEEPFGILALELFCATILKNVRQAESSAAAMQDTVNFEVLAAAETTHHAHPVVLQTLYSAAKPIGSSKFDIMHSRDSVDLADVHSELQIPGGFNKGHSTLPVAVGQSADVGIVQAACVNSSQIPAADAEAKDLLVSSQHLAAMCSTTQGLSTHSSSSNLSSRELCSNSHPSSSSSSSRSDAVGPGYASAAKVGHSVAIGVHWGGSSSVALQQQGEPVDSCELRGADSGDDVYLGMPIAAACTSDDTADFAL